MEKMTMQIIEIFVHEWWKIHCCN